MDKLGGDLTFYDMKPGPYAYWWSTGQKKFATTFIILFTIGWVWSGLSDMKGIKMIFSDYLILCLPLYISAVYFPTFAYQYHKKQDANHKQRKVGKYAEKS